jgi:glutamine synthetase
MRTCDNHVLYKAGAKEIAAQEGMSLTFMSKFDEREGNSCHVHISLRSAEGDAVMAGDRPYGFSPLMEHFIAGQLACLQELTYFLAPEHQLLQALRRGQLRAHGGRRGGQDNRTCALRVVGHGLSLRMENRLPGGT